MDNQTLRMNTTSCDKCCGDGRNYLPSINEILRQWRKNIGVKANQVCAFLGCDGSVLSKFENGRERFSEKRIREYISFLSTIDTKGKCSECLEYTDNKNRVCNKCLDAMEAFDI